MKESLHTPWSDVAELITFLSVKDAQGFETITEFKHPVFCNWQDGVSQSEFYRSFKADMRAAAQLEIHKADLYEVWPKSDSGEHVLDFNGSRYKVLRDFPQSFDTQTLILSEVIR